MKKMLVLGVFVVVLCVGTMPAMAEFPGLQDILDNITVNPNSPHTDPTGVPNLAPDDPLYGPGAYKSSIIVATDRIADPFDAYWEIQSSGTAASQLIIEVAGHASTNIVGVFDATDLSKKVILFSGSASAGYKTSVSFDADGSVIVGTTDSLVDFADNMFGFYMQDNAGNIFYSDTSKNADLYDHMWSIQGNGTDYVKLPNSLGAGKFAVDEYILAFEDTYGGGDLDHNDFVFMVESINAVPVPGAILLGLLGIGAAGLKLRRFA